MTLPKKATIELPVALYTAAQCRQLDKVAIEEFSIPGIHLMKRAGRATFEIILARWGGLLRDANGVLTVVCGSGNNAGDGYIVAALAREQNLKVQVLQVGDGAKPSGDAAAAFEYARRADVTVSRFDPSGGSAEAMASGVIVDALLGTGIKGDVRPDYQAAINAINSSINPVVAVDIPSGLSADTGAVLGAAVNADATVTFIGLKRGLSTGRGPALVGSLYFNDLNVPAEVYRRVQAHCRQLRLPACMAHLRPRQADAHKGDYGHVLVVGGDHGMGGAVAMAAEAAARAGAGLVSAATRPTNVSAIVARRPEIMSRGVDQVAQLQPLLERASVVVLGPGLGQSDWSKQMFNAVLNSQKPLVVDADGLNLLAKHSSVAPGAARVLTPHPGEAARLLGTDTSDIQSDRFAAATNLQSRYGGVIVLKGAGSIVASVNDGGDQVTAVAAMGNPGMASGGMGDVLSGIIGALLAQGLNSARAAELGVCLHAAAADRAVSGNGQRGLLATDLMPLLRQLVNGL